MTGIYKGALVEIIEQSPNAIKIKNGNYVIQTSPERVMPVPGKVLAQYIIKLNEIDEDRKQIFEKIAGIKNSQKKLELEKAALRLHRKKQSIIREIYFESLNLS